MPRGHMQRDASLSPKKSARTALTDGHNQHEEDYEMQLESEKGAIVPFASQLDEIARNASVRPQKSGKNAFSPTRRGYMTMPPRSGRTIRQFGNGLYDSFGRGRPRVGIPIEATAPFPDPVAPSGGPLAYTQPNNAEVGLIGSPKDYVGYTIERAPEGCGSVNIDRAAEWGRKACNTCEPDH